MRVKHIFVYFHYKEQSQENDKTEGQAEEEEEELPEGKVKCPRCSSILLRSNISRHMKTHDGLRFPCPHENCSKSYTQKKNLDDHITKYHAGSSSTIKTESNNKTRLVSDKSTSKTKRPIRKNTYMLIINKNNL